MLYMVKFDVGQPPSMTHAELFEIWYAEAEAALAAKDEGAVAGIWKVAGERTVYVLCELADNHALDELIEALPIMQKMGGSIQVKPIPVYPYEQWAEQMRGMIATSAAAP